MGRIPMKTSLHHHLQSQGGYSVPGIKQCRDTQSTYFASQKLQLLNGEALVKKINCFSCPRCSVTVLETRTIHFH